VSLNSQCRAYTRTFFPERLCNYFKGLRRTFSDISKTFNALLLSVPSRNRTTPNKRTKKIRTFTHQCEICFFDFIDVVVLSSIVASRYYSLFIDGSTSPGNYGYSFTHSLSHTHTHTHTHTRARARALS
jgi:hypothetical protein